ncbi:putative ferric-chelate reductase 1 homolog [Liolophura sinensis]|uniref:putative ferric-chelate reductase 1 homolog n=1 Tax=Liolophura sinensis TaxID=3198878 RepID=UPI00315917F0
MQRLVGLVCSVVCLCIHTVQGHPSGATATACVSMAPPHSGTSSEVTPPPFEVAASSSSYLPNNTLIVVLSAPCGTETFAGFLLEARRADAGLNRDEPLGTFENVPESHYVEFCGNGRQAVTHKNDHPKSQLTFQWTAPAQTVGHIVFVATFAKSKSSYWVKVYSEVVRDQANSSEPNPGGETYPTPSTCDISPTQPPAPQLTPDKGCGTTKYCFSDCQDSSCGFLVSWRNSTEHENGVEFEIAAPTGRSTNTWIAIGFSEDNKMGDDKVVECVSFRNDINVYTSYNTIDPRLDNVRNESPHPDDGVHQGNSSLVDGIMKCSFVVVTQDFSYFNLDEPFYLLFASGNTATFKNNKIVHKIEKGKFPVVSKDKIDFVGAYRKPLPGSGSSLVMAEFMGLHNYIPRNRYENNRFVCAKLCGLNCNFQ